MRTTSLPRITLWLSALTFQHMVVLGVDVVGRVAWEYRLASGASFWPIRRGLYPTRRDLYLCRTVAFPALSIEVLPPSQDDLRHPVVKHHVYGQAPPPPPDPLAPPRPERRLDYPIQLIPTAKIQYEEIKVGFNPIAMLMGNPMYLLMGGMAVFMMIMPKLIGLMDPETLAEVQANQADLHKQMASIQDMDLTSGRVSQRCYLLRTMADEQPSGSQASAKSTSHASESHAKRRK
ncbi:hypothetical protein H4Q26_003149 [Puccinia striiformis f. sp. tritici PST-130]|nr:hypothetical protein H4Q26_003149 [Puccinia striiformis f. sp. tritici PST-130]